MTLNHSKFVRRKTILEENVKTDEKFRVELFLDHTPQAGDFFQFQKDDGGYRTYQVSSIVRREVNESKGEYDLYVLVTRAQVVWQPM